MYHRLIYCVDVFNSIHAINRIRHQKAKYFCSQHVIHLELIFLIFTFSPSEYFTILSCRGIIVFSRKFYYQGYTNPNIYTICITISYGKKQRSGD